MIGKVHDELHEATRLGTIRLNESSLKISFGKGKMKGVDGEHEFRDPQGDLPER